MSSDVAGENFYTLKPKVGIDILEIQAGKDYVVIHLNDNGEERFISMGGTNSEGETTFDFTPYTPNENYNIKINGDKITKREVGNNINIKSSININASDENGDWIDLAEYITVSGKVNSDVVGTYPVTYTYGSQSVTKYFIIYPEGKSDVKVRLSDDGAVLLDAGEIAHWGNHLEQITAFEEGDYIKDLEFNGFEDENQVYQEYGILLSQNSRYDNGTSSIEVIRNHENFDYSHAYYPYYVCDYTIDDIFTGGSQYALRYFHEMEQKLGTVNMRALWSDDIEKEFTDSGVNLDGFLITDGNDYKGFANYGDVSIFLKNDGTLVGKGDNGATIYSKSIFENYANVVNVELSEYFGVALLEDGSIKCWSNKEDREYTSADYEALSNNNILKVAVSDHHVVIQTYDLTIDAFGIGDAYKTASGEDVPGALKDGTYKVLDIDAKRDATMVYLSNGKVMIWGNNHAKYSIPSALQMDTSYASLKGDGVVNVGLFTTFDDPKLDFDGQAPIDGAEVIFKDADGKVVDFNTDTVDTYTADYYYLGQKIDTRTIHVVSDNYTLRLKGDSNITVQQDDAYVDAGAEIYNRIDNTIATEEAVNIIKVSDTIDTSIRGTYTVTYEYTVGGVKQTVSRTVNVVNDSLVLRLIGENPYVIKQTNDPYVELGAEVFNTNTNMIDEALTNGIDVTYAYASDLDYELDAIDPTSGTSYKVTYSVVIDGAIRKMTRDVIIIQDLSLVHDPYYGEKDLDLKATDYQGIIEKVFLYDNYAGFGGYSTDDNITFTITELPSEEEGQVKKRYDFTASYVHRDGVTRTYTLSRILTVTKATRERPTASLIVVDKSETEVELSERSGAEYQYEGGSWQDSPIFNNLEENKTYTFYYRWKETDTTFASEKSDGLEVTTYNLAPSIRFADYLGRIEIEYGLNANVIDLFGAYATDNTNRVDISDRMVVKILKDGISLNTLETSGLAIGEYTVTFNVTDAVGNAAEPCSKTVSIIEKSNAYTPPKPVVINKGHDFIELEKVENGEYNLLPRVDVWTDTNIFNGLNDNTDYSFRVRIKQTATQSASNPSDVITVKTDEDAPRFENVPENQIFEIGKSFDLLGLGLTVVDNYDGNLTDEIIAKINNVAITDTGSLALGTYEVVYSVTDSSNSTAETSINIEIIKTRKEIPEAPEVETVTSDSLQLVVVSDVEYSIDGTNFNDTGYFSGLIEGDTYTIYARKKADASHSASLVNDTLKVKTLSVAPEFNGLPEKYIYISEGDDLDLLEGVTAIDHIDGDMTDQIILSVNDTTILGLGAHSMTFSVSDTKGNTKTSNHTLYVYEHVYDKPDQPVIQSNIGAEIVLEPVTHAQYRYNGNSWRDSNVFSNLREGVAYTFEIKMDSQPYERKYLNNISETTTFTIANEKPVITLKGENLIKLGELELFVDPGVEVTDNVDPYVSLKRIYTKDGETVDGINYDIPGEYVIIYRGIDDAGNEAEVTRTVIIEDTGKPVIHLNGDEIIKVAVGQVYAEQGATVTDFYDDDLTVIIGGDAVNTNVIGTYWVTYNAQDTSGNMADEVARKVEVYDSIAPTVTLNGDERVYLNTGEAYEELGASVTDNYDTNLQVVIGGDIVDANIPGLYTIIYTAEDSSGNESVLKREVVVKDTIKPVIKLKEEKVLTIEAGNYLDEEGFSSDYSAELRENAEVTDNHSSTVLEIGLGDINFSLPGEYFIKYNAKDMAENAADEVTSKVMVVDTTKPVIESKLGDAQLYLNCDGEEPDWKAYFTASDVVDGSIEITDSMISEDVDLSIPSDAYRVKVTVVDKAGNEQILIMQITVKDTTAPHIELVGDAKFYMAHDTKYIEPGVKTWDNVDGEIETIIEGGQDNNILTCSRYYGYYITKEYLIKYTAVDQSGNQSSTIERTIVVEYDESDPSITLNGDEEIILEIGETYIEKGAVVTDDVYKNLQVVIGGDTVDTSQEGRYIVTYDAVDGTGKQAETVYRTIHVTQSDHKCIVINGDRKIYHKQSLDGYEDAGAVVYNAETKQVEEQYTPLIVKSPKEIHNIGTTTDLEDVEVTYSIEIDGQEHVAKRQVSVIRNLELKPVGEQDLHLYADEDHSMIEQVKLVDVSQLENPLDNPEPSSYTIDFSTKNVDVLNDNYISRIQYDMVATYTHKDGTEKEYKVTRMLNIKKDIKVELLVYDENHEPTVSDDTVTVKQGHPVTHVGIRVLDKKGEDITGRAEISESADTSELGEAIQRYTVTVDGITVVRDRNIMVVADLVLLGTEDETLTLFNFKYFGFTRPYIKNLYTGYTSDMYSGDLVSIEELPNDNEFIKEIKKYTFKKEYYGQVFVAEKTVNILYDKRLVLNGEPIVYLKRGSDYEPAGAKIVSKDDPNQVIKEIKPISSNVTTNVAGIYKEHYSDESGKITITRTIVVRDDITLKNAYSSGIIPVIREGEAIFIPTNEDSVSNVSWYRPIINDMKALDIFDIHLSDMGLNYIGKKKDNSSSRITLRDASHYYKKYINFDDFLKMIYYDNNYYLLKDDNQLNISNPNFVDYKVKSFKTENAFTDESKGNVLVQVDSLNNKVTVIGNEEYQSWFEGKENVIKVSLEEETDSVIVLYSDNTAEIMSSDIDLSSFTQVTDIMAVGGGYFIINDGQLHYFGDNEVLRQKFNDFIDTGYENSHFISMAYTKGDHPDIDVLLLKDNDTMFLLGDHHKQKYIPETFSGLRQLELKGKGIINLLVNTPYEEYGAQAYDRHEDKVYTDCTIYGEVDTTVPGTYYMTYTYQGMEKTRTVNVKEYIGQFDIGVRDDLIAVLSNGTLKISMSDECDDDIPEEINHVKNIFVNAYCFAVELEDKTVTKYIENNNYRYWDNERTAYLEGMMEANPSEYFVGYLRSRGIHYEYHNGRRYEFEKGTNYTFFRDEKDTNKIYIGNKMTYKSWDDLDMSQLVYPSQKHNAEAFRREIGISKDMLENVADISFSDNHMVVLKTDGAVQAFGDNAYDKSTVPDNIPDNIEKVFARGDTSIAVTEKGELFAWGRDKDIVIRTVTQEYNPKTHHRETVERDTPHYFNQDQRVFELSYAMDGIFNATDTTNINPKLLVKYGHGEYTIKYAKGKKNIAYFKTKGKEIPNEYQFDNLEYGTHTLYIMDKERNTKLVHFEVKETQND